MLAFITNGLALSTCLASTVVFYLGCPNQQWFHHRKLSFYPALAISLILLACSGWLFQQHLSAVSSVFATMTATMLLLGVIPFLSRIKEPFNNVRKKSSLVKDASAAQYQPQWWLRIIGTFVLGYPLAVGISGLYGFWSPGPVTDNVKSQLAMWLITPLWFIPISLIFFTHKPTRALAWLSCFNVVIFLLVWLATSRG